MSQKSIENLQLDIEELRSLLESAKRPKVKDFLSIQLRKVETEMIKIKEEVEAKDKVNKESVTTAVPSSKHQKTYDVQVKTYSWDQSDKFVKIYLTGMKNVQNIPKEDIKAEFTGSSVKARIENLDGKNYIFEVKETCEQYNSEKSYFKVKTDMVSIFLCKKGPSEWSHLKMSDAKAAEAKKPKAPSVDENEDPSQGLMKMMKQMYDEGDDEMKRTIAKAWTEGQQKRDGGLGDMPGMPGF